MNMKKYGNATVRQAEEDKAPLGQALLQLAHAADEVRLPATPVVRRRCCFPLESVKGKRIDWVFVLHEGFYRIGVACSTSTTLRFSSPTGVSHFSDRPT